MEDSQELMVQRIISGGQTGVDRAALDAAIFLQIEHGGWCPLGRLAEDGEIPRQYQLTETKSPKYSFRTRRNVDDAQGTLIFYCDSLSGGTSLTFRYASERKRPFLLVDLCQEVDIDMIRKWLIAESVQVLNVAGPRESSYPGISDIAREVLIKLLE
jgi:hypothetical protein